MFVSGFNYHHADRLNSDLELPFKHKPTGAESSMISGRISWFYDFQGASLTIDTACSSSLVGLHLARQSLEAKESDMVRAFFIARLVEYSLTIFLVCTGYCQWCQRDWLPSPFNENVILWAPRIGGQVPGI